MTTATSVTLPLSAYLWMSRNPFEPSTRGLIEEIISGPVAQVGYFTTENRHTYPIPKGRYDLGPFSSMGGKLLDGLVQRFPIADGLSDAQLNIVSLTHWAASPRALAAVLGSKIKNRPKASEGFDRSVVDWLQRMPPAPGTWYKLIYTPSQRGMPVVRCIVAEHKGYRLHDTYFDRMCLVTCPAWHEGALYAGLPIEGLA